MGAEEAADEAEEEGAAAAVGLRGEAHDGAAGAARELLALRKKEKRGGLGLGEDVGRHCVTKKTGAHGASDAPPLC